MPHLNLMTKNMAKEHKKSIRNTLAKVIKPVLMVIAFYIVLCTIYLITGKNINPTATLLQSIGAVCVVMLCIYLEGVYKKINK